MKKQLPKFYVLLLLALLFAAPGIAALFFYQHPDWLGASKVNKGLLLTPPLVVNDFDKQTKWRIVLLSPEGCDKTCMQHVNLLGRVRLALGRKLYQVDEWLLLGDNALPMPEEFESLLKKQDVHVKQLSAAEMAKAASLHTAGTIFIVNPDNFYILGYSTEVNPNDVYNDLKLLLNTTEKKSG